MMAGFSFARKEVTVSFTTLQEKGTVTVAGKASVDIPPGTLNNALKQAGLKKEKNSMRYLVVVEKGPTSYGAYIPDLPGCVAVGETKDEALSLIREAIEVHLDDLKDTGQRIPAPTSSVELVEIDGA